MRFIERHGVPLFVSFDHDLAHEHYKEGFAGSEPKYGEYKEETGYESAKWLKEHCEKLGVPLPAFQVHSMNIVGKQNIRNLLNAPTRRE